MDKCPECNSDIDKKIKKRDENENRILYHQISECTECDDYYSYLPIQECKECDGVFKQQHGAYRHFEGLDGDCYS
jgi:ssDNA-binding Zn-finger/Zn-ribbon topoisomerase 1